MNIAISFFMILKTKEAEVNFFVISYSSMELYISLIFSVLNNDALKSFDLETIIF
jgi:hypothetical protein